MDIRRRVILGTGGPFAGRATRPGDAVGYLAGHVRFEDLLASIPTTAGLLMHSGRLLADNRCSNPVKARIALALELLED